MAPNTSQWAYDILQTYAPLFAEGQAYLTPNFGIPLQGIGDPAVAAGFAILDALAGQGSGSSSWSALTNPTTNLNLSMGLNSSTFDYAGVILTLTGVTATTNPPPTATYAGTITGGANNAYAGAMVLVEGFPTPENNGWWLCVSSTATQLVLANQTQAATIESASATAKITGVFNFANTTPASGFTEHQNSPALSFTGAAWNLPGVSDNDTWVVGSKITGGGSSQTSAFTLTHYGDIATSGGLVLEEIVAGTPPFISSRLFGVEYFNISATQNDGSVFNSKNYPLFLRSGFTNATNGPALGVTMGAMSSTTVDQVGVSLGVTAGGNNILFNPSSGAANGVAVQINAESNQTGSASGNFTAFAINAVKTSFLGTSFLVADFQIGGGSLLNVAQDGTHLFSTAFVEGQNFQFNSGSFITDTLGSTGTANQILTAGVGGDVVWGNLPSFGTLYLDAAASTIGGYASLITTYPTTSQTTYSVSGSGVGTVTLIKAFASSALNLTTIPAGMWTPSIYASVDSLTQNPQFQIDLYTRTSGGVETLQASLISTFTSTAMTLYTPTIELGNIGMNPTDLVVVKVSLLTQGASTRTATVYIDLTSVSHLHLPTSTLNTVVPWSSLANAQKGLILANDGFSTTFNQTSAVNWTWANTTAASTSSSTFTDDGSQFGSWVVGVGNCTQDNVVGNPAPSYKLTGTTNAASMHRNAASVLGTTISVDLNWAVQGSNTWINILFGCDANGQGLLLRLDSRGNNSGLAVSSDWFTQTAPTFANGTFSALTQGTWYTVNITISDDGSTITWSIPSATGWSKTVTGLQLIRGTYFGLSASSNYTVNVDNITWSANAVTDQSSPVHLFSGAYYSISGASSVLDSWNIQNAVDSVSNRSSLSFAHTGTATSLFSLVNASSATSTKTFSAPVLTFQGSYFSSGQAYPDLWQIQQQVAQPHTSATVTNVAENSSSVVTLTITGGTFVSGDIVTFTGLTTATWLNGINVTLATANATTLTFNDPTLHGTQASHAETGQVTQANPVSTLTFSHTGTLGAAQVIFPNGSSQTQPGVALNGGLAGLSFVNSSLILYSNTGLLVLNDGNSAVQFGSGAVTASVKKFVSQMTSGIIGLQTTNTTAATSGTSQSSPILQLDGKYWDGAASQTDSWTIQDVVANGTNGTSQLTLTHSGSAGVASISVPAITIQGGGSPTTCFVSSPGYLAISANPVLLQRAGANQARLDTNALRFGSGLVLGFSSNADPNLAAMDTAFSRVSAGVVAIGNGTALDTTANIQFNQISKYNGETTAAPGVAYIRGVTSQKSETGADASVLSVTPASAAGTYRINIVMSVSAANTATLGWTATWTDSNGTAQTPTNLALFKNGTAAPALTFSAVANDTYHAQLDVDVNNAGTAIVVMTTFSGTSIAYKVTATIERIN